MILCQFNCRSAPNEEQARANQPPLKPPTARRAADTHTFTALAAAKPSQQIPNCRARRLHFFCDALSDSGIPFLEQLCLSDENRNGTQGGRTAQPNLQSACQLQRKPIVAMNQGCNATIFESELPAFALPAGLDRPPRVVDLADLETRRLDDSFDALDVLELSAPVLALNAADLEAAMLFAESPPRPTSSSASASSSSSSRRSRGRTSPKISHKQPHPHPHHHSKKASRKQVHELQLMVNAMQVQVDGAAAEIQQIAQLVGQLAHQREQEQQQLLQLSEQQEMDMQLGAHQRQMQEQAEHFKREQMQRQQEPIQF
uniref:Uncharacterized protein n=1 Tax=Phytophthora ramorum TaxID=164328 RepID=H3GSD9_PHYRM